MLLTWYGDLMTNKFRFLCDVDGIVADFVTEALAIINSTCSTDLSVGDVTSWELLDLVKDPASKLQVKSLFNQKGLCASLKPYHGAIEALVQINSLADLYFVTAPLKTNPYWMFERHKWLVDRCGVQSSQVNFVKDKFIVGGDIFLDDSVANVNTWIDKHPGKLALLWTRPWNASCETHEEVVRVDTWEQILGMVSSLKYNYDRLLKEAEYVLFFGESWLFKPTCSLCDMTPFSMLLTDEGTKNVIDLVKRIEYGVYI
jgi:5'(3')-deoxyribonucleotidase